MVRPEFHRPLSRYHYYWGRWAYPERLVALVNEERLCMARLLSFWGYFGSAYDALAPHRWVRAWW